MKDLTHIDVSSRTRKLNQNDYLPWTAALEILQREFGFENVKYGAITNGGYPARFDHKGNAFVEVYLDLRLSKEEEFTRYTIAYPILNFDVPIKAANAAEVNKAIQRGFVKLSAIATGLGLSLWQDQEAFDKDEILLLFNDATKLLGDPDKVFEKLGCSMKEFDAEPLRYSGALRAMIVPETSTDDCF